jgi:hypothetical protein
LSKAKSILKARILIKADRGRADQEICRANISMVARVREMLMTQGLDGAQPQEARGTIDCAPKHGSWLNWPSPIAILSKQCLDRRIRLGAASSARVPPGSSTAIPSNVNADWRFPAADARSNKSLYRHLN